MSDVFACWLSITGVLTLFSLVFLCMEVASYNDACTDYRKRDARKGVRICLIGVFTSWAWPLWCVFAVVWYMYKAFLIAFDKD